MPQFLSRSWGWFQARSNVQKAGIVVVSILVPVAASRVVYIVAGLVFVVALGIVFIRLVRRQPVRVWAIAAGCR
jgi:hypothetical protein